MDGFYTHNSTKKSKKTKKSSDNSRKLVIVSDIQKTDVSIVANNSNEIILPISTPVLITAQLADTNKCDVITLKDNQEINCIISEINTTEIKYKKCDNPTGPTFIIAKSDVFFVTYKNGTVDLINSKSEPKVTPPVNNQNTNTQTNTNTAPTNQNGKPVKRKIHNYVKLESVLALIAYFSSSLAFYATFFAFLPFLAGVIGFILAFKALAKIKQYPEQYKGKILAYVGMAVILLGVILSIIVLLAL